MTPNGSKGPSRIKPIKHYRPVATRLAVREYLPFGAWLLAWFLIGLAVGHADAVRLLAANALVQAVRAVGTLETGQALSRKIGSLPEVLRRSSRKAWRIELFGLLAVSVLLGLFAAFLALRGMEKEAAMTAIVGAGLPARHPGLLLVAHRNRVASWRTGAAVASVIGAGLILLLGLSWIWAAVVLATRDWGGLVATALLAPPRKKRVPPDTEPLTFGDVAGRTEASARRRLSYRLIKSLASVVLGPFGNIAARTGREVGKVDTRLARFVPRNKPSMILFTLGTTGTALFFFLVSREPASFLAGAAFARLAATGGAALLWWRYAGDHLDEEDDEE